MIRDPYITTAILAEQMGWSRQFAHRVLRGIERTFPGVIERAPGGKMQARASRLAPHVLGMKPSAVEVKLDIETAQATANAIDSAKPPVFTLENVPAYADSDAMRLITEPCKGRSTFTCPWHAWTYDLDGKLVATPKLGGERQNRDPAMNVEGLDLKPVRIAQWEFLVFVCLDPDAPDLAHDLGDLPERLAPYRLGEYRLARRVEVQPVARQLIQR